MSPNSLRGITIVVVGLVSAVVVLAAVAAAWRASAYQGAATVATCSAAEMPAAHSGYDEWQRTLLDPGHVLPADYVPPDLVRHNVKGQPVTLRSFAFAPLVEMLDAAAVDGVTLVVSSSFRSYQEQAQLAITMGHVDDLVARAGHSEHQLGTAIDVDGGSAWLRMNAARFGFVISYPYGRPESGMCYRPEPWHLRYMGVARAAEISASALSVREWLLRIDDAGVSAASRT